MNECVRRLQSYVQTLQQMYNQGMLYDFLSNYAYDIYLEVGLNGDMRDYHIVLGGGGPAIELQYGKIVCYDMGKEYSLSIPREISDELWSYIEQMKGF